MAEYGLQVWDAQGALVFDIRDRITQYYAPIYISADGFVDVPGDGAAWFLFDADRLDGTATYPNITIAGRRISWSYNPNSASSPMPGYVHYGRY